MIMVNPEKYPVVADSIFLKTLQVFGHMPERVFHNFRVFGKPLYFFNDSCGCWRVNRLYISIKITGRFYSIHKSFFRCLSGLVLPDKWSFRDLRIFARNWGLFERKKSSNSSSRSSKALVASEIFSIRETGTLIVFCISFLLLYYRESLNKILSFSQINKSSLINFSIKRGRGNDGIKGKEKEDL